MYYSEAIHRRTLRPLLEAPAELNACPVRGKQLGAYDVTDHRTTTSKEDFFFYSKKLSTVLFGLLSFFYTITFFFSKLIMRLKYLYIVLWVISSL